MICPLGHWGGCQDSMTQVEFTADRFTDIEVNCETINKEKEDVWCIFSWYINNYFAKYEEFLQTFICDKCANNKTIVMLFCEELGSFFP